jgi:hypothetical protein
VAYTIPRIDHLPMPVQEMTLVLRACNMDRLIGSYKMQLFQGACA